MNVDITIDKLRALINQDWRESGLLLGQRSIEIVDSSGRTHAKIGDLLEVIERPANHEGLI